VKAARVLIISNNLIRVVNTPCYGGPGNSRGIVDGGVGIDWHDTGSSLSVSLAESLNRKAEPLSNLLGPSGIPRGAVQCSSHNAERSGRPDISTVTTVLADGFFYAVRAARLPIRHA